MMGFKIMTSVYKREGFIFFYTRVFENPGVKNDKKPVRITRTAC
jgi:hypothetical protein